MHFISQELEDYIEQHSEKEPELLVSDKHGIYVIKSFYKA